MVFSRCLGHMTEALTAQSLRAFFPEWKTEERRDREKNFFSFPSIFSSV